MVYSVVQIVYGIPITEKQLRDLFDMHGIQIGEDDDMVEVFHKEMMEISTYGPGDRVVGLIPFKCCSELNGKMWIFGTIMRTYHRKSHVRCDKCKEHYSCDRCLGETEGGWFDVSKIVDELMEIDQVCQRCFSCRFDQGRCVACGHEFEAKNAKGAYPSNYLTGENRLRSLIKDIFPHDWFKDTQLKYYYMLDDCLSCT